MLKLTIFLLFFFSVSFALGQTDSLSKEDRLALDSMFQNDEFIKLMLGKKKSYFDIRVGAGNQLLSTKNNNVNAGALKSSFALIPVVTYNDKSGFGLALSSFFASDSGAFKPYQYAVNPYFEYYSRSVNLGVYYTRYIFNKSSGFSPNPFQNAYYFNFVYIKTFIEPGISLGYASGHFTDTFSLAGTNRKIEVRLSDLSLSPYVQHNFSFYKLFSKHDGLNLTPSLMLIAGRQRAEAPGLNLSRLVSLPRIKEYLKNRFESDSKFQLQSVAGSLAIKYQYKKFYTSPGLYIDYYLPSTTEKRLTTVFSVTAGFTL
ncbi:MAG TPA: hypothetical protein VK489_09235 [Ferruginibacter sp.]|nr:hypothetical protein [Ferruginibacter sp.]